MKHRSLCALSVLLVIFTPGASATGTPNHHGASTDVSTAGPLLKPELRWEGQCIEAPTVMKRRLTYTIFYVGAYNNSP